MSRLRFLLVAGCVLLPGQQAVAAQSTAGTIQGTVRTENGGSLAGVNVLIVGTRLGAITRTDGRYTIPLVSAGTHRVSAQLIGYATQEQEVTVIAGQAANANFTLATAAVALDQLVVVGYGTTQRRDLTGSVSSVTARDIATMPVARVDQAISGMMPGIQVQTTNSQPGSQMRIRIRGGNSLNASNEPLVVVDGVIGADLNQINPNDVESVDILKDASATAIYGARGANGVILVTTKRGRPGEIRFEYNGYTGLQAPSKRIDVLNASEFARLLMRNPTRDRTITLDTLNLPADTDWQEEIYDAAPIQDHQLTITGASGGTSARLSAALFNQSGVVIGSDFKRGSIRFNLDQEISARFRAGTRVSYSRSVGNEVRVNDGYGSGGGPITMMALRFAPVIAPYDANGKFSGPLIPSQTMDNPIAIAKLRDDKSTTNYLLGDLFGELTVFEGLTARSSLAYTFSDGLAQRYTSRQLRSALNLGQANVDDNQRTTWLSQNTLTLRRTLAGDHDLTLLGGFEAQQTRRTANTSQGQGFTSDVLGYRRLNLAETVTGSSSQSRERLVSFLGRANYGFSGKYLLTATMRADGSSKFAENNKWAYFPSAAVAWRVSEESFFKNAIPAISEMKLRASVGRTGSEAIGAYQSLASWSVGAIYSIGRSTFRNGATPSRNANPNLKWETTTQVDAGLDMGLFNNRVSVTADVFRKRTADLLYEKQVPYFTGYEDYVTNIGKVENKGFELAIDTRHHKGAFEINVGGNFTIVRNKVLDLGGDTEFFLDGVNGSLPRFRPAAVVRVGEPLGNFFGWVWNGIFQDSAEVASSGQAGARVGSMKLKDINGDSRIDSNDRTILGNALPDYMFGLTGRIGYKALSLSYVVRGVQGFDVVNLNRQGMETPGGDSNALRAVLDYWTPENKTNKMTALGVGPYDGMTSRWVEDGSFIRLQNLTIGADIPERLSGRLGLGRMHMYLSGQNLFTQTSYSWYDPEVSSRGTRDLDLGWDDSSYPGVRTFTLGINVVF